MKTADPDADPFREWQRRRYHERFSILGADFDFYSDSSQLMKLVRIAYRGLATRTCGRSSAAFVVSLVLGEPARNDRRAAPPPVQPIAAPEILAGALHGSSFMTVNAAARSALVVVAPQLLRHPYHVRYELIEFAVYCLAARGDNLVPLHAACLGRGERAALLLGDSGAGKSTIMLHSLRGPLDFIAEDSVLVSPRDLGVRGVANFLHVRADSLQFSRGTELARRVRSSAVIQRRSGVRKFALDLRRLRIPAAGGVPRLAAILLLSSRAAGAGAALHRIPSRALPGRLRAAQPYAAHQPGWSEFVARAARLPAYELWRGDHPDAAVAAISALLEPKGRAPART